MPKFKANARVDMKGAIFFSTKYGSTAQYAEWISECTDLPVFNVKDSNVKPTTYDFLVLGSPVIYHKLMFHKWVAENFASIMQRPTILFSVSGAPAGPKLDGWIADSLPAELIAHMHHIVLRGRQNPKKLSWFDRVALIIGGLRNPDPVAAKEELKGFDFMDKSTIDPIVELVGQFQKSKVAKSVSSVSNH
jgi:menaquinone-dependent protoporphyrinogen IX oxidase